ncbi:MAG: VCBS repeat-containing protein [Candidatus Hydrogenedentes bacterium]|nr:VCBS repeat-containing protein [Candidatus Hydrogenedentota bacterium]
MAPLSTVSRFRPVRFRIPVKVTTTSGQSLRFICSWAMVLASLAVLNSASAAPTQKWSHTFDAAPSAPTLYPNETHPAGVAVAAGKQVFCFNGDGSMRWVAKLDSDVSPAVTVADLDGDGAVKTIVGLASGVTVCLDGTGQVRWRYDAAAIPGGFKIITAADVHPSKGLELLAGHDDGWLKCLSADGRLLWRFHGAKFRVSPVAVGDADADGAPEIVYGTDNGDVYCLDGFGRIKWRYNEMAPFGRSGPNLADLDGDGKCEVLITRSNVGNATCLMALDGKTGAFLWRTKDVMQGYVSNAIADFSGSGKLDVLHGDKGNWIYRVRGDGSEVWRKELGGKGLFWAPAVADIDGDGHLETVVGLRGNDPADNACAYVVGQDGTIDERLPLGSGANASPAIGDVDGDGKLEAIITTEGPNQIHVLTWGASGRVAWPSMRGNSAMTAATRVPPGTPSPELPIADASTVDIQPGAVVWGRNVWRLDWPEPAPEKTCLELAVTLDDGTRETRAAEVNAGAKHADIEWNLTSASPATITLRLIASGRVAPLFAAVRSVKAKPVDYCNIEELQAACQRAVEAGRKAHADTRGVLARLNLVEAARQALASSGGAGDPSKTAESATRLRDSADAARGAATSLERFWASGQSGSFVWWRDDNPWDTFDPLEMPGTVVPKDPIRVAAYGNEFEDVAISLLNISPESLEVRCTFAPPMLSNKPPNKDPDLAKHVTLRRGVRVPTQYHGMILDALPELDRSRTMTLAPGEASQLWLAVDTHGLEPGTHALTLYVGSLSLSPTYREIPIQIQVWPVALPDDIYAKMNWNTVDKSATSDQVMKDMLEHGESVAYGSPAASVPVDAKGNLSGPIDWSAVDAVIQRVPPYFKLLFTGPPPQKWPDGVTPPQEGTEEQKTAFKTSVREFAKHLVEKGFDYNRWAFYPIDEPWNTGFSEIPRLRAFCTLVKEADPKARNYADPPGLVRVEYVEEFKDLIDVWQPEMNVLKRDPKLAEWFRKNAGEFWAYEAPGPAKDMPPLGHYRAFAWYAWNFGCSGAGYWVYRDLDQCWPIRETDYGAVYQTGNEVIPSRRWEASRDGVEDYRAFYVLSKEIERARAAGKTVEADRAQALLAEAIEKVIGWHLRNIDEITRFTKDEEIDFTLLSEFRTRIAQETISLRGVAGPQS